MEAILKTTDTPLLESTYKTYIGRVLKETSSKDVQTSEKEQSVLAEGDQRKAEVKGVRKYGDDTDQMSRDKVMETAAPKAPAISEAVRQQLQRAAGLL
jgi:ASC-1-like (ASCH) protein